ncbi:MAG TPA: outer membrane lipoprotein-sorting protein [Turneriella sp.]|nr:outer membrane lipoprotein-sorting protein [Turneriella sp.]HNE18319.1 outer membrane lipoprotein-sorting protein [Turneriella sp.]HNJ64804.1 outer membrane lipoprotein-sorting protein [Turneriella sp.]HNL09546.1 outer membrane lipoprotein-sorting protein [Turneriella sp.]HNL53682.1 outer membrane lipoprotein-sorting protein [Turneriella sp.]
MNALSRLVFALVLTAGALSAQGKTGIGGTAFEIMDRVFQQLQYAEGHQKLQLTITTREGKSVVYKGSLYQKQNASFFVFDSMTRGTVLKLLYNDQGQNIYAYQTHDKRLFHKKYLDRFESVLGSGFAYLDIANASFIDNYQQKTKGTEKNDEGEFTVIENIPLDKGHYGKLIVLVDPKKDNRVKRIDYYDSAMVLMKTMTFTYGMLSVKEEKNLTREIEFPIRWDMADVSRGTVSTLEFFSVDKTARLDASLFKKENIEK